MKVIKPKTLVSADITNNSLPVSSENEYASGTTYSTGDIVKVSVDTVGTPTFPIKTYKSLSDNNTGNYPPDNITKWSDQGAVNQHAMFDDMIGTQSVSETAATEGAPSTISFTVDTSSFRTVALFNTNCTKITIILKDSAGTVMETKIFSLSPYIISNFYDYFYAGWTFAHDVFWDFLLLLTSSITVIIEHETVGEYAKCGNVLVGSQVELGKTQYGITTSIMDFSKKEKNAFGYTYLKQGNFAKLMNFDIIISNENYDQVQNILTSIRGKPTLFSGNNDTNYEAFNVLGFFRDFDLIMKYPTHSECSMNIEGLI